MSAVPSENPPNSTANEAIPPQPITASPSAQEPLAASEPWSLPPRTTVAHDALWNVNSTTAEKPGYSRHKVYGMKSRFSLATIIVMIVAASLLLAMLKAIGVPPLSSAFLLGLIAFAALCQMTMFGGRRPRLASVIAGVLYCWAGFFVAILIEGGKRRPLPEEFGIWPILGAGFGYGAGGAVAGVLLLMELVESWLPKKRSVPESDDEP